MRVAVLQRVCPSYRVALFEKLTQFPDLRVKVFIGEDFPRSKVKSAQNLGDIDYVKLPTKFFHLLGRTFVWHKGLFSALEEFNPDVVIGEGESHIICFILALYYKRVHPKTRVIHWSLGGLPGEIHNRRKIKSFIKFQLQKKADAFVVYSSYGKKYLESMGHDSQKIFVATNVCDSGEGLLSTSTIGLSKSAIKQMLNLPDKLTVLYVGALEANKKIDVLLKSARMLCKDYYNFIILGDGAERENLENFVASTNLSNVIMCGRISPKKVRSYYEAADIFVLPGRGGMVISEAMSFALPIVVGQADGTEYDLVVHRSTGIRLQNADEKEIAEAFEFLRRNAELARTWGKNGRQHLINNYTIEKMVENLAKAIGISSQ